MVGNLVGIVVGKGSRYVVGNLVGMWSVKALGMWSVKAPVCGRKFGRYVVGNGSRYVVGTWLAGKGDVVGIRVYTKNSKAGPTSFHRCFGCQINYMIVLILARP